MNGLSALNGALDETNQGWDGKNGAFLGADRLAASPRGHNGIGHMSLPSAGGCDAAEAMPKWV